MTAAHRVRALRYAHGWGPDELAERADVSRTALYQIESGRTGTPRAGTLRRVARALGVPIAELLDGPRAAAPAPGRTGGRGPAPDRRLVEKLADLLASPLGGGVARLIEEAHRLLHPAGDGRVEVPGRHPLSPA